MEKAVVIVSGGMDSVTLAHLLAEGNELHIVSFNYGQRHAKELQFAKACAERLKAEWTLVDMGFMSHLLKGSALTDNIEVPEGHYEADNMRLTVVPNRNAIMLSIATGIAVANKANFVATGVHAGDHAVYPDCRPEFITALSVAMIVGNQGFATDSFQIAAPFVGISKAQIVGIGHDLEVPWDQTWSCYKGLDMHCGRCGTCVERKEAFVIAGVIDPTDYFDPEYAISANQ